MLLVHILRDGVVLVPPFPAPKIPRLLHAGSVQADDFFWHEGMPAWEPVGTRWVPDAGPAPATTATTPPIPTGSTAATSTLRPLEKRARWQRSSILHEARKRYHETLVPWSRDPAIERGAN